MTSRKMLNVMDFGAKGDGKTDDTAAIQKALDAAGETFGTVFVPEGVFMCGELKMRLGTGIHGLPNWSFRNSYGSVLKLIDTDAPGLLNITEAIGASIYGITLHGGKSKHSGKINHGILFHKTVRGKIEDTPRIDTCRVERFSGDGMHLEKIFCFSIRHCQSAFNSGNGIRMRGVDGFILDNWMSGNGLAGYGAYEENAAITMTGNRIEWNKGGGILAHGGGLYNITGNYIDRSGRCGIKMVPCGRRRNTSVTITGNIIIRSGKPDWGIDEEFDSSQIRIESGSGIVCAGNTMHADRDDGSRGEYSPDYCMVIRNLDDSIIKDNTMFRGSLKELLVDRGEHGPNVIIKDNVGSLLKL